MIRYNKGAGLSTPSSSSSHSCYGRIYVGQHRRRIHVVSASKSNNNGQDTTRTPPEGTHANIIFCLREDNHVHDR